MLKRSLLLTLVVCLMATLTVWADEAALPAGTLLLCTLDEPNLSSHTAEVGDPVLCSASSMREFEREVFPRGAYLAGHFEDYRDPGRFFGKGWLKLEFDRLILSDTVVPISARVVSVSRFKVGRDGRILARGHPKREAVGWVIPVLWPMKVFTLPMRGPRPALPGESRITLKLLEDVRLTQEELSRDGPDSAQNTPSAGNQLQMMPSVRFGYGAVIQMVGSGSFDPAEKTIVANGSFRQINSDGSVAATGTWEATNFLSFIPFGGPNRGLLGGVLELTVTLLPVAGAPQTGVPMSVTCLLNPPRGFTWEEGITIGFFVNKVRGKTVFHMSL